VCCEGSNLGLPERSSDPLQRPVDLVAGYHKWRGNADCVSMGILGKDASTLQRLRVATCVACFRVKLDRQHQSASAHLADRVGTDAP
jgi:hypothetical protein